MASLSWPLVVEEIKTRHTFNADGQEFARLIQIRRGVKQQCRVSRNLLCRSGEIKGQRSIVVRVQTGHHERVAIQASRLRQIRRIPRSFKQNIEAAAIFCGVNNQTALPCAGTANDLNPSTEDFVGTERHRIRNGHSVGGDHYALFAGGVA